MKSKLIVDTKEAKFYVGELVANKLSEMIVLVTGVGKDEGTFKGVVVLPDETQSTVYCTGYISENWFKDKFTHFNHRLEISN